MKVSSVLTWTGTATRAGKAGEPGEEWPDVQVSARFLLRVEAVTMTFTRTADHMWRLNGTLFAGERYLRAGKDARGHGAVRRYGGHLDPGYRWLQETLQHLAEGTSIQ